MGTHAAGKAPVDVLDGARPRGPRGDRGELSDRILDAARVSFATRGFQGTSLRSVAEAAEVDSSLVNYYFSSKRGLLEAVLTIPDAYLTKIVESVKVPMRARGRSVLSAFLELCDGGESGDVIRSIFMCASYEPLAVQRMRETFIVHVTNAVAPRASDDERRLRTGLVATHFVGLAMTRYVWRVGPLSELSSNKVVELLAPTVQRYLSGPLP